MSFRFSLFLILLLAFISPVSAQPDDITQMGMVTPLYFLENGFSASVTTSGNQNISIEINDIAVESDRILIRFYIIDLPDSIKAGITDEMRLYGSYLPIAELILNDGTILTPSSESRYSILEYNSRLILGGLMIFYTDLAPQAFYFNFNQIPFETQPLSESFSKAVILTASSGNVFGEQTGFSTTVNDLTFTLSATAQTNELTMLQPAARMLRSDEILSKFGWITITDTGNGKRFAAERGNLYGFNLADDRTISIAHAYVFSPVTQDTILEISMDYAYIIRQYDQPHHSRIDFNSSQEENQKVLLADDDFHLLLNSIVINREDNSIRLYIDSTDKAISDISFEIPAADGTIQPSTYCGIDPENKDFACDIYFGENSFPNNSLEFDINAIEYRKNGPWILQWTPSVMETLPKKTSECSNNIFPSYIFTNPKEQKNSEMVQRFLDKLNEFDQSLFMSSGWIYESFTSEYSLSPEMNQDLIPVDQYEQYLTSYISETWFYVEEENNIGKKIAVIRDLATGQIISAQMQTSEETLDLLHSLLSKNTKHAQIDFESFRDFRDLTESSAVFIGDTSCGPNGEDICFEFQESLTGIPGDRGSQNIVFRTNEKPPYLLEETIDYDSGMLVLSKKTQMLEKTDVLAEDIQVLLDSLQ